MLLTLFILSGILIITLAAADLVLAGLKMNRLTGYSNLAFFASEAGMERALWEARKSGNPPASLPETSLANGSSYVVIHSAAGGNNTFKSTGSYLGAKRSVESTY